MDAYGLQDTWLGTVITLSVAVTFAWLTALAVAHRALAPARRR